MKIFKHIETGHTIFEEKPNNYSIYERMGYEEVQEVQEDKEVKPKKVRKK